MRATLEPHPAAFAPALRIEAQADRAESGRLMLRYVVTGELGTLLLPPPAPPGHADRLWLHTCFEAFLQAPDDDELCRAQFRAVGPMGGLSLRRLPHGLDGDRPAAAGDRGQARRRRLCAGRLGRPLRGDGTARRPRLAARPFGGDRGRATAANPTGRGASAGQARLPSPRLLCARTAATEARMKFGIDRLLADPALRAPLAGRRVALLAHPASVTARPRPIRSTRSPPAATSGSPPPSAPSTACAATSRTTWSRVAGLQRSGPRHPGVQPLRRGAPADRPDDGARSTSCWSTCRTSAAASTPSSPPCSTCSRRRRSTARRSGCSTAPIPPAARSRA